MADTFLENFMKSDSAKVCGLSFLRCAFRMLIGWASKLQSRGIYYEVSLNGYKLKVVPV